MRELPSSPGSHEEPDLPEVDAETSVDLTLVRYYLGLTPEERLRALNNFLKTLAQVKVIRRRPEGS